MTSGRPASQGGAGRLAGVLLVALAVAGAHRGIGGSAAADTGPSSALRAATGAAPTPDRCPLTAEQVSSALGTRVKGPDSSCSFFPADESKAFPSAAYVKQVPFICSGNTPADDGYTEKVDGLGTQAYVADRADGSWILVCRSGAPFEIRVDAPPNPATARAAATALARQILAAR